MTGEIPTAEPENEFDTGTPGPPRPAVGLLALLTDEQKAAALAYDGPEYFGPASSGEIPMANSAATGLGTPPPAAGA